MRGFGFRVSGAHTPSWHCEGVVTEARHVHVLLTHVVLNRLLGLPDCALSRQNIRVPLAVLVLRKLSPRKWLC